MLVRLVAAAALVTLMLPACRRSFAEKERKVVGTWDRTGMDSTERTTYRADHTMESTMSDGSGTEPFAKGTWHLEDDTLVEEFTVAWQPVPNETPPPKQNVRTHIVKFEPDKLVRESGRPPLVRVK
jgi:hypothetical protein